MISFSSSQKTLLILIVSLIIFGLFVWLVAVPLLEKIKTASQEYSANQKALFKLGKKAAMIKDLKKNYEARQADLSEIEGVFLSQEEIVKFISTLEEIALQTNNIFEIQIAQSGGQEEKTPSVDFNISLSGGFPNLIRFIAYLEDTPYPPYRLISLEKLTVRRLTEQSLIALPAGLMAGDIQSVLNIKIFTQ